MIPVDLKIYPSRKKIQTLCYYLLRNIPSTQRTFYNNLAWSRKTCYQKTDLFTAETAETTEMQIIIIFSVFYFLLSAKTGNSPIHFKGWQLISFLLADFDILAADLFMAAA